MLSLEALRSPSLWPEHSLASWRETYASIHLCTQVVGKIRLGLTPKMNQWWNAALYLSARGLTTSPIQQGERTLEIEFDFVDHQLWFRSSDGQIKALSLVPRTVAEFYREVMAILDSMGLGFRINTLPCEIPAPVRFEKDTEHASYDAQAVRRFWQILRQVDVVFKAFRARFRGKCSPVHFFWGSFDLAVTRFSGRMAPPRPQADRITQDAYDEEVISLGFWPGDESFGLKGPAFYSYASPEPSGLWREKALPEGRALYLRDKKEFILPYDDVRVAEDPVERILDFAQSTYDACARLAGWDREGLEYKKAEPWRAEYPRAA